MTELDQTLEALKANPEDPTAKMNFYGRFLHTIFFVPIQKMKPVVDGEEKEVDLPLIIDNDGSDFLVFFDDQKRLNTWAEKHAPCAQMPGYAIAEISSPGVWWAMNVGTDHDKQFSPDEIAWLKDVLARSKGAA
jgi:hypothetical protein